jgi:hypothetical protein
MEIKIKRNNQPVRIFGNNSIEDVVAGPVHISVQFSDGTIISKYGNTNYWVCITGTEFLVKEAVSTEDLFMYLPKVAAEELIYNIDQIIKLGAV